MTIDQKPQKGRTNPKTPVLNLVRLNPADWKVYDNINYPDNEKRIQELYNSFNASIYINKPIAISYPKKENKI
jgi:hypothetical protein